MTRPTPEKTAAYNETWIEFLVSNAGRQIRGLCSSQGLSDIFQERWHAGCFLSEKLTEAGADQDYIQDAQFKLGQASVGRDAWSTFDQHLAYHQAQLALQTKKATWASTPLPQQPPPSTSLFESWYRMSRNSVGDKGVFPMHLCYRNRAGDVFMEALAVSSSTAACARTVEVFSADVVELVAGFDHFAVPKQDISTNDFLSVVWYVDGQFYAGVIEYDKLDDVRDGQEPRFGPVRWDNNYWAHALLEHHPIPTMKEKL